MALTQISTAGVKDDAVTSGKIPANAVGSSEIADNAVDAAAIAANAVTEAKLDTNAVTTNKIANSAINQSKLADASINAAKIQDQQVTLAKLPHGTSSNDGKFLRANNGADPTFETVTSTTINNNGSNRIITGSSTANTLEGESTFTYDGVSKAKIDTDQTYGYLQLDGNSGGSIEFYENGNRKFEIYGIDAGLEIFDRDKGAYHSKFLSGGDFEISDGNLKLASGHGIDFSATANASNTGASMSNELLSDYEEGSWTPTLNSGTVTTAYANYVRIGRMCWLTADFYNMSDTTSSTAIMIPAASLPFSKSSFSDGIYMGTAPNRYFSHSSKDTLFHWFMNGSGIHMQSSNDAIGDKAYSNVLHSHIDASYSAFKLAGWYVV